MSIINKIKLVAAVVLFAGLTAAQAQVNKVNLTQTKGEFTTKSLTLEPGDYQFVIANEGVGHDVGFVLAPKGKTDPSNHIKEAYVTSPVKTGSTSMSQVVSLEAGEYVYFCPLNPTEEYSLTVSGKMMDKGHGMMKGEKMMKKGKVRKVELAQTKGAFTTESLSLAAGKYQFVIANQGVGHDVGFVLAPKGKTTPENHIKEAYVTSPVKDGSTSMSQVVTLEPGEYVYFCPLNPTKEYSLTVTEKMMKKGHDMKKKGMKKMEKGM